MIAVPVAGGLAIGRHGQDGRRGVPAGFATRELGPRRARHAAPRIRPRRKPTAGGTPTPGSTTSASKDASTGNARRAAPVTVAVPGAATTVTAPGGRDGAGTSVSATGQMAEGFEAEQADSSGMGLVSCSHPSSDMWFVGSGEPDVWLYLTNSGTAAGQRRPDHPDRHRSAERAGQRDHGRPEPGRRGERLAVRARRPGGRPARADELRPDRRLGLGGRQRRAAARGCRRPPRPRPPW